MEKDFPLKPDSIWLNCHLACCEGQGYGVIHDGALAVSEGKLAWVGRKKDLPENAGRLAEKVYDLKGAWVTPGLIDCHTHLIYGGGRAHEFEQRLNGVSYEEISRAGGGIVSTVRATREADEQELYEAGFARLTQLMKNGVTTVEIKSGYGLDLETELKMLRTARRLGRELPVTVCTTYLGAHALPPEYAGRPDDYIDFICDEVMPRVAEENLADSVDAFCETIGFTPDQTRRVFEKARELGLPVKLHAEQLSDQKGSLLAAEFGALSVDHLEYLDPADAPRLKKDGVVAVLLPGAFYFLREEHKPPVGALRNAGVAMAISTDLNPGTSPALSLPLIMNLACTMFRLTPMEALTGATINAARALGLDGEMGSLSVGKSADLAIWNINEPAELAYFIGGSLCRMIVKGGKPFDPDFRDENGTG